MKINLDDVTNIDSITTINANFDKIVEEFQDKVLYRDSPTGEPNTVESNIDMNGFDIINVKDVYSTNGRWATINEMLALNSQTLTYKNQALQYSLDSLQYKNDISDIAIDVQGYQLSAEFIYDQFNSRYLGTRNSDPTTDNKGNTLQSGAMYFRTTAPELMRIYNGSTWQDVGSIATSTTNTVDPALFASTLEAQQGTSTAKVMSPARVKDAIDSQVKGGFTATGPIVLNSDASNSLEAVTLQQVTQLVANSVTPSGAVQLFAMDTAPTGWLAANGQVVSRTTYAALFAAIGTTYGPGDGFSTFRLPDLRGEFVRGWDNGRGVDGGRSIGSAQVGQVGQHDLKIRTTDFSSASAAIYFSSKTALAGGIPINAADSWRGEPALGATQEHQNTQLAGLETRPRNIAMLYCIKT